MKYNRLIVILIACTIIMSCVSEGTFAPLDDKPAPPSRKILTHIVAPGETLYSIAWRYDLDVNQLSKVNDVIKGSTIFPGQRLVLDLSAAPKAVSLAQTSIPRRTASPVKKRVATPITRPARSQNTTSAVNKPSGLSSKAPKLKWIWPCKCRLAGKFKGPNSLRKGIDLKSKLGESIYAAAAGEVVYSGERLRGYGKLLIIKHSDILLSAYAHNQVLLVKEGDIVKVGQQIGKMGRSGTTTEKLYFEIRLDGRPINPLKYLPQQP